MAPPCRCGTGPATSRPSPTGRGPARVRRPGRPGRGVSSVHLHGDLHEGMDRAVELVAPDLAERDPDGAAVLLAVAPALGDVAHAIRRPLDVDVVRRVVGL